MRRASYNAASFMLVFFGLALVHSAVHVATESHAWCPEHHRTVHVTHSMAIHDGHAHGHGDAGLPPGHEAQQPCDLLQLLTTATTLVSPWPTLANDAAVLRTEQIGLLDEFHSQQLVLYRLAPGQSPPLA